MRSCRKEITISLKEDVATVAIILLIICAKWVIVVYYLDYIYMDYIKNWDYLLDVFLILCLILIICERRCRKKIIIPLKGDVETVDQRDCSYSVAEQ